MPICSGEVFILRLWTAHWYIPPRSIWSVCTKCSTSILQWFSHMFEHKFGCLASTGIFVYTGLLILFVTGFFLLFKQNTLNCSISRKQKSFIFIKVTVLAIALPVQYVYCKNKIVILAFGYYSCMTIFTMQILWMQCWKLRNHAVITDTSLPQNVLHFLN